MTLMGPICAYVLERQLTLIAHMFSSRALMSVYGKPLAEEKQKTMYATLLLYFILYGE